MRSCRWVIACINWGSPDFPHALSYRWDGYNMFDEEFHETWPDAIARVDRARRLTA